MNWWQLCKREFRQMFITDRRRAVFLFGASMAYLLLFGLLYGTHTVKSVPLVIYDEDQTAFSRSLIQNFADSERFQIAGYALTEEDMEYALRQKEAYAAIHIPQKFAQDSKAGRSATVLLAANGSNIIITNTITTAAQEIMTDFSRQTGTSLVEQAGNQLPAAAHTKVSPIELRFRVLNNPTQSYLSFFVVGLAMAAFQQGVFLAVGASIQHEYQHAGQLRASSTLAILTGKLLPYWITATLAFFITIATAVYGFAIPGKASFPSIFLLSATFILAAVGFSALLATLCSNELTFTRISIAYTVPAFILSGYTWPVEAMDPLGQTLFYLFPLSYFSTTVRELLLAGYSPSLWFNSLVLLCMGLVFTVSATLCFKKRNTTCY